MEKKAMLFITLAIAVMFIIPSVAAAQSQRWAFGELDKDVNGMSEDMNVYDPQVDESDKDGGEVIEAFYTYYKISDEDFIEIGWEDNTWNSSPTWFVAWAVNGDYRQQTFGSASTGSNPHLVLQTVVEADQATRTWRAYKNNELLKEVTLDFKEATNSVAMSEVWEINGTPFVFTVDAHQWDLKYGYVYPPYDGLGWNYWSDSVSHDDSPYDTTKISDYEYREEGP